VGFLQRRKARALSVDGLDSGDACVKMSFVATDQESDEFVEQPFDGILGLGLESSSDLSVLGRGFSFLSQLAGDGAGHGKTFALRLGSSGASQLFLGGFDESGLAGGRALWVPLSSAADGYWQFSVRDLTLDGQEQHFGAFQVAVDSGTSLLAADEEIGEWLREHLLPKSCRDVDNLPKLGLRVGDRSILTLLPADYVDQIDGHCILALMPSKLQSVGGQRLVLGDSFMRRYITIFDQQQMQIGFGIAADESMANEMLPDMFPPQTTPPPPTASELEPAHGDVDSNNAFSGLVDDLAGTYSYGISQ